MKTHTKSTCLALAAALLGTGCAQAAAKQTQAPKPAGPTASAQTAGAKPASPTGAPAGAPAAAEKKIIASVVKPMKKTDGLFALYQDTTNGSLMMTVPKTKLGKEFIYFTHVVEAPVAAGAFRGGTMLLGLAPLSSRPVFLAPYALVC